MGDKSKFYVNCTDLVTCEYVTVEIMAYNKVDAKERVLENHRTYEINGVFSEEEDKLYKSMYEGV